MSPELIAVLIPLVIATTAYIARQSPSKRSYRQFMTEPENQAITYDAVKAEEQRRAAGQNGGKLPEDYDPRQGIGTSIRR